jgi:hypothetical protein
MFLSLLTKRNPSKATASWAYRLVSSSTAKFDLTGSFHVSDFIVFEGSSIQYMSHLYHFLILKNINKLRFNSF